MQVRWTSAAADDLENIANYLFEKTPQNAARLIREIYGAPTALRNFPNRGRAGKKEGTRELVLPSMPYIIVYHVTLGTGAYRSHPARRARLAEMNHAQKYVRSARAPLLWSLSRNWPPSLPRQLLSPINSSPFRLWPITRQSLRSPPTRLWANAPPVPLTARAAPT